MQTKTQTFSKPSTIDMIEAVKYPVMEHFYTLQGEGYWAGSATYFIRLAGCDVGCFWCDVKESWAVEAHPLLSVKELLLQVRVHPSKRIVITGGEPLLHNLDALTQTLRAEGYKTHIETSGTQPLSGEFDWICFSPKKFKAPLPEFYAIADELKVIVHNWHDLEWAEKQAAACAPKTLLYLQPQWYRPESTQWIIEYVKQNPKWRISLQTHKFLQIP